MKAKAKIILFVSLFLAVAVVVGAVYYFCFALPQQKKQKAQAHMVAQYYTDKLALYRQENLPETKIILVSLTSTGMDWGRKNQLAA